MIQRYQDTEDTNECSVEHLTDGIKDEDLAFVLKALVGDIRKIIPEDDKSGAKQLFPLARIARTAERDIKRELTCDDFEEIFNLWVRLSEESGIVFHYEVDGYFIDFIPIFESTKVPHDEGVWQDVVKRAKEEGSPPGYSKLKKKDEDLRVLANLCYYLDQVAISCGKNEGFPLSVRKANEVLPHLSIQTINNRLRYLLFFKLLSEVSKGSAKKRKASYYRYIGGEQSDLSAN
jgi:hypothetical protein